MKLTYQTENEIELIKKETKKDITYVPYSEI
jgi:hypothetical protein